jgi:hypothetical protein
MTVSAAVKASMNYSVDNGRPIDYYFYEPSPSVDLRLNPPGTDTHDVAIHDGWSEVDRLSVDKEGFELHEFGADFLQFDNDALVKEVFYQQVISYVKRHTGAKQVVVFDHTIRKRMAADLNVQTEVQRPAVMLVHSDYTVISGPQRVRDVMKEAAEPLLQNRVAFYNVWKPLYSRVEELPLAMIDAQTHGPEDLLRMDLKYSDRTGEIYVMRHNPEHRWLYFPLMESHHALLLKTYDSSTDGRCRFMGHSAFEDPTTPAGAAKRESIEVRTMAFF